MSDRDFAALRDDIASNGMRQPIVLHDGMILDGGNRYRACIDAGIEPTFIEFDGDDIGPFVLSANLHRRHLSAGQHAAIVASVTNWSAAAGHGGDRRSDQSATLHLDTAEKRAVESGASVRTQKMADKVAKADSALAKQVAHGAVSLPDAVMVADMPEADRKAVVDRGPEAVKQAARQQKAEKPDRTAELESEIAILREQVSELSAQAAETLADNESMAKVFEADDKVAAALAEAKKFREMNRLLEERIRGLQGEKNEAVRMVKSYKAKLDKLEKVAA